MAAARCRFANSAISDAVSMPVSPPPTMATCFARCNSERTSSGLPACGDLVQADALDESGAGVDERDRDAALRDASGRERAAVSAAEDGDRVGHEYPLREQGRRTTAKRDRLRHPERESR